MSARSLAKSLLVGTVLLAAAAARAEDPFLGQIKAIKCVGCKPGWVTLIIHDPIDLRDYELHLKDTDYNKIITPLPGKRIHERPDQCFYWMEKPKAPAPAKGEAAPAGAKAGSAKGAGDKAPADSVTAPDRTAGNDSLVPPPLAENQGTPSTCIKFYRSMN